MAAIQDTVRRGGPGQQAPPANVWDCQNRRYPAEHRDVDSIKQMACLLAPAGPAASLSNKLLAKLMHLTLLGNTLCNGTDCREVQSAASKGAAAAAIRPQCSLSMQPAQQQPPHETEGCSHHGAGPCRSSCGRSLQRGPHIDSMREHTGIPQPRHPSREGTEFLSAGCTAGPTTALGRALTGSLKGSASSSSRTLFSTLRQRCRGCPCRRLLLPLLGSCTQQARWADCLTCALQRQKLCRQLLCCTQQCQVR